MDKVIVTGVAGFLGSFLAERLIKDNNFVIGIDNLFRGKRENINHLFKYNNFEFQIVDVSKEVNKLCKLFENVDFIFHYAAINGTQHFYERPLEVLETNVEGTINMLKAASKNSIEKFVFASSSEVYGDPLYFPTDEKHPILLPKVDNPRHSYAASKAIGEFYVKWYAEVFSFNYLVMRIFNVYGPRMDTSKYGQVIPEFIRKILVEPEFEIIGSGTQTRSFCYIEDNIEMTLKAFDSIKNEILNIGNNYEVKILDLAQIMHEILGKKFKYKLLSPREGDPLRRVPNIEKFLSMTGCRPKISLKEGLERTIDWYRRAWGLT